MTEGTSTAGVSPRSNPASAPPLHGVPRLPSSFIPRERLSALLNNPPAVTIVEGPAGSGRRSLVTEWLRSAHHPAAAVWIDTRTTGDNRRRLWAVLLRALSDAGILAAPFIGTPERLIHDAGLSSPGTPDLADTWVTGRTLTGAVTLVFADADTITDLRLADDLALGLALHPEIRVIVTVLDAQPLAQQLDARGIQYRLIGGERMLFTPDETRRAFDAAVTAAGGDPRACATPELHTATGGLPLAVRAAAITALDSDTADAVDHAQQGTRAHPPSQAWIFNRLPARLEPLLLERLAHLAPAQVKTLQRDAARLAMLEQVNPEDAVTLLGPDAAALLTRLQQIGLGRTVDGRFSFLPVTRAAALTLATTPSDKKLVSALANRPDAEFVPWHTPLTNAITLGDLDLASRIATEMFLNGRMTPLPAVVDLLGPVPLQQLRPFPTLLMTAATALRHGGTDDGRATEYLRLTVDSAHRHPPTRARERLAVRLLVPEAHRLLGESAASLRAARLAADELTAADGAELPPEATVIGLTLLGECALEAGDLALAETWWARASAHSRPQNPRLSPDGHRALAAAIDGRLPEAQQHLDALAAPTDATPTFHGALAEAILAIERFDLRAARSAIARVDASAEGPLRRREHWAWFLSVEALLDLLESGPVVANTTVVGTLRVQRRRPRGVAAEAFVAATTAITDLARGESSAKTGAGPTAPLMEAREALAHSRTPQVLADTAAMRCGGPRVRAEALLLDAVTLQRRGRQDAAMTALSAALDVTEQWGLRLPFALTPRADLTELLATAAASGDKRADALDLESIPTLLAARPRPRLSDRERAVLAALAQHPSQGKVAEVLELSPNTVKSHVRSIYRKLGVTNRDDAVAIATELGLVAPHR